MIKSCFIIVSKNKKYEIIVDDSDLEEILKHKWWIKNDRYVYTQINRKTIHLHRFILKYTGNLQVDHINHNTLDNRKSNLRIVTISQNNINKSNIYSGVRPYKSKYRARIKINGKEIHIGVFGTLEAAIESRITKEIELFNKYSKHYKHD